MEHASHHFCINSTPHHHAVHMDQHILFAVALANSPERQQSTAAAAPHVSALTPAMVPCNIGTQHITGAALLAATSRVR